MKKDILLVGVVGIFAVYTLVLRHQHSNVAGTTTTTALSTSNGSDSTGGSSTATVAYKDGTYTGTSENAFYGNVQVSTTISGGKITTVTFLSSPNDSANSQSINSQAMPILKQEAIKAQSAHVDVVSGATQTSDAFAQSLASALQQAKV